MKQLNFLSSIVATVCLCASCNNLEMPDFYTQANEDEAPSKYVPYQTQYIDVPEGSKSMVYIGNTLIATCYQSGNVVLPKKAVTKATQSDIKIVTVPCESATDVTSENSLEMVVAFEDTKEGDHDYNDLVFQAHLNISNESDNSTVDIDITPIAMGASLRLGLGVVLTDANNNVLADYLITEDCRTSLFKGDGGFINTQDGDSHTKYDVVSKSVTTMSKGTVAGISWYLISQDQRLYASNYFQACLDNFNMPQGLVLMKIRQNVYFKEQGSETVFCGNDFWQYPIEYTPIEQVYPNFEQAFLEGGDFSVFAEPAGNYYDAIGAEDDGHLSNGCLYEVYKSSLDNDDEESALAYYDLTGKACNTPQTLNAVYNPYQHSQDNFILEFSTANGNAIDFDRGDVIQAKITVCGDHPFMIGGGIADPTSVPETGKVLEAYTNAAHNWWRIQDNHQHEAIFQSAMDCNLPLIVRISKADGIEYFKNGKFEKWLDSSNEKLASILEYGTDKPLIFGLFGNYYSYATYEYLMVSRNIGTAPVESVAINPESKTIAIGETATLAATVYPIINIQEVAWTSSNTNVATVDPSTGTITGIGQGTCTIKATSTANNSKFAVCSLSVVPVPVSEITLEDKAVVTGHDIAFTAKVLPANAANKSVIWSSSNTEIATINQTTGVAQGISDGTCIITATSVDNPFICATCTLTVSEAAPELVLAQNFTSNVSTIDAWSLSIISSGTPTNSEICFNNGDYIEAKFQKKEIISTDKDLFYVGSKQNLTTPYICLIGHNSKYTEIYSIPGYWWSTAAVPGLDIDTDMYLRLGCKADGTRGCGSWSLDGENWTDLYDRTNNGRDIEGTWSEMIKPAKSPLIIQTARYTSSLQLTHFDYIKVVRGGASE